MILRCTIILHEKEFFLYNISLDPQILISEQYIDIQGQHLSFYPSFLLYLCAREMGGKSFEGRRKYYYL